MENRLQMNKKLIIMTKHYIIFVYLLSLFSAKFKMALDCLNADSIKSWEKSGKQELYVLTYYNITILVKRRYYLR